MLNIDHYLWSRIYVARYRLALIEIMIGLLTLDTPVGILFFVGLIRIVSTEIYDIIIEEEFING